MQTNKKVFSSALLALAIATLLPSCETTGALSHGSGAKYGLPVPYHTNYIRSPYTRPAQLVHLKGAQPGDVIVCPYTGNNIIVPGLTGKKFRERQAASADKTKTKRYLPKYSDSKPAPARQADLATAKPVPKTQRQEASAAQARPQPRMLNPSEDLLTAEETIGAPPPPAPPRGELPYGTSIPGKPGFVRSPYAAAHQLVDVSGLSTGSEVKCPYTNKLFRVPAPEKK